MKRIRDEHGEVSKKKSRLEGKDVDRRTNDDDDDDDVLSTQKICQALQCTYQAKALAADDFALQVILLDSWSGSSEGKYRGDFHCIVVVFLFQFLCLFSNCFCWFGFD